MHCSTAHAYTPRKVRSSRRSRPSLGRTPRHRFSRPLAAVAAAAVVAAVPLATADAAMKPPVKVTHLSDDFFNKGKLTIKKGTIVNWKWNTDDEHTVTE